jgi:hypothetical protein
MTIYSERIRFDSHVDRKGIALNQLPIPPERRLRLGRRLRHRHPVRRHGQSGIYGVRERTNVVAQRTVGTIDRHRDNPQDEHVFSCCHATWLANHKTHKTRVGFPVQIGANFIPNSQTIHGRRL